MADRECQTCGGTSPEASADGVPYFHVCPPATVLRVQRHDGSIATQRLEQLAGVTIVDSPAARDEAIARGAAPASVVVELERRYVDRPDRRDENTAGRTGEGGRERLLKAYGRGAIDVATRRAIRMAANDSADGR